MRRVQIDRGNRVSVAFRLSVEAAGCTYRYIQSRRPQQKRESGEKRQIDDEDFWQHHELAELALHARENRYNHHRFSMALGELTPVEKLHAKN